MPNAPIDFILVRARDAGFTKYIPVEQYEAERDLWAQVAGGKTVTAMSAPTYEPATDGGSKPGQKAASEKENS